MEIVSHCKAQIDPSLVKPFVEKQIIENGDLYEATVKEQLEALEQLMQFEYGRWLLVNRGLNGYWYRYFHHYTIHGHYPTTEHPLEIFMMQKAPGVLASYEQQNTQTKQLRNYIQSGMTVASVPCGYMDHLLRLDLSDKENIRLVGIDLDPEAIEGATNNAKILNKEKFCEFMVKDAWALDIENEFDILVSNALNIYAPTEACLLSLYGNFYRAIKPNGYFVMSALTAPLDDNSEVYWNMDEVDMEDLRRQKLVYYNVIKIRQGVLCTEVQTISQLLKVGFKDIKVLHDKRKMYLTVIASK